MTKLKLKSFEAASLGNQTVVRACRNFETIISSPIHAMKRNRTSSDSLFEDIEISDDSDSTENDDLEDDDDDNKDLLFSSKEWIIQFDRSLEMSLSRLAFTGQSISSIGKVRIEILSGKRHIT